LKEGLKKRNKRASKTLQNEKGDAIAATVAPTFPIIDGSAMC
jgi:hypothetical protein